jgi:DNA-binding MarR family transcriptional regulator
MARSAGSTRPASAGTAPGPVGEDGAGVAAVADSFSDLQRTVRRAKARLLAALGDSVDSATQLLLHTVAARGPMRASALAECAQSDLSTVSRQVTALVGRGLLERQADQGDGRASLLAVTDAGRAAVTEHERGRRLFFSEVLDGWTDEETGQFARQLVRFTADYDRVHTTRMNQRAAQRGRQ